MSSVQQSDYADADRQSSSTENVSSDNIQNSNDNDGSSGSASGVDQTQQEDKSCPSSADIESSATPPPTTAALTMTTSPTSSSGASNSTDNISSPQKEVCHEETLNEVSEHHHQQQQQQQQRTSDESNKASWESGILDLSPSSLVSVKLLVSNNMAGSIIGRAGETISEIQEQSSSRIKLGQSGDCYPGTCDRACLVHGSLDNVKKATELIIQKLYDLQLQQVEVQLGRQTVQKDANESVSTEQDTEADKEVSEDACEIEGEKPKDSKEKPDAHVSFSVRILIPSSSCGMLIGRNGSNIKKLKETSCVSSIRLSAKEPDHASSRAPLSSESLAITATSERILTITGQEMKACLDCTYLILEGFARHPDICRYTNNTTSYSKITSTIHAPFGAPQMGFGPVPNNAGNALPNLGHPRGNRQSPTYVTSRQQQNLQPRIHQTLRFGSNRSDPGAIIHDPTPPDQRGNQRIYGLSGSNAATNSQVAVSQVAASHQVSPMHLQAAPLYGTVSRGGGGGGGSRRHTGTPQESQHHIRSVKISVPDSMVGAILGKRGQTLTDLQSKSGTRIKISQRGEFIPGTNNRIVTISGPNNENIAAAQVLIRQHLARNAHDRMLSSPLPEEES